MAYVANIRLPDTPVKGMQLECNGSLSRFNTRVEKYSPVEVGTTSSMMALPSSAPTANAGPRALETASQIRQDTLTRQQDKEAKLNEFLEATRARLSKAKLTPKKTLATIDDDSLTEEKTRRRLDQSMTLIPRPLSAIIHNKRVRASWAAGADPDLLSGDAGSCSSELFESVSVVGGAGGGGGRGARAWMDSAVMAELSDGARARSSLLSHRRTRLHHDAPSEDSLDEAAGGARVRGGIDIHGAFAPGLDGDVLDVDMSGASGARGDGGDGGRRGGDAWEGVAKKELRAKESRLSVYKEIRRAMMTCERARVREVRTQLEEEDLRERSVLAARRTFEEDAQRRAAAEQGMEEARVAVVQQALAHQRALERKVEAQANEPRRHQVEEMRFLDALRCRKIEIQQKAMAGQLAEAKLCPCVPPRTVQDSRVWLCANNCALKCNARAYHRLVRDLQAS